MYRSFYQLTLKPFQISTDPKFLWLGEKHKEALAILKYGILDNRGFLLLTGDVGTGKTTLINALVQSLGDDVIHATIVDPGLTVLDFYRLLVHSFAIKKKFRTKGEFLQIFSAFLRDAYDSNIKVLLIVDEAQRLSSGLLEEIRLLSNIEMQQAKLLNIFFVGQNEFNNIILAPDNRAIRQRITINYTISPLSPAETAEYIRHRLKVAGTEREIFSSAAIREIHRFSHGYPRLINIVCDRALLSGFVREKKVISAGIIKECASELQIDYFHRPEGEHEQKGLAAAGALAGKTSASRLQGQAPWASSFKYALLPILLVLVFFGYFYLSGPFGPKDFSVKGLLQSTPPPEQGAAVPPGQPQMPAPDETAAAARSGQQPAAGSGGSPRVSPQAQVASGSASGQAAAGNAPGDPQSARHAATPVVPRRPDRAAEKMPEVAAVVPAPAPAAGDTGADAQRNGSTAPPAAAADGESAGQTSSGAGQGTAAVVAKRPAGQASSDSAGAQHLAAAPLFFDKITIRFTHNSNELTRDGFDKLDRLADKMRVNQDGGIVVTGYTDVSGNYNYNMTLSQFRANLVKSYLVGKGVDPQRIRTLGMGPFNPVMSNETLAGRIANRRVEIERAND